MGQTQVRPMLGQQLGQVRIVRKYIHRPGFDLCQYTRMEVLDLVGHVDVSRYANYRKGAGV